MESIITHHRFLIGAVVVTLLCAGCSSKSKVADAEAPGEGVVAEDVVAQNELLDSDTPLTASTPQEDAADWVDPCDQEDTAGWLDGTQEWVYETTCRSAAWFDGFFGTGRGIDGTGETQGRAGLSGFWDQRDGFDPKFRFRVKLALPALNDRANLMVGRGDEQEIIEERTLGATMRFDIDQLLTEHIMLRSSNYGNVAQSNDIEGLEWESSLFLFHALSNRKALTYRVMVLGKTQAEEPLANYGFEFRFRRRVYRDWLFLELISSATWPKEFMDESRDLNIGIGAGFEMYFGPVPDHRMY